MNGGQQNLFLGSKCFLAHVCLTKDDKKCSEAGKMKKDYWHNDAGLLFQSIVVRNYYNWFSIKGSGTKGRSLIEPNQKL